MFIMSRFKEDLIVEQFQLKISESHKFAVINDQVFTPATDVRGATGLGFRPYPLSAIYLTTRGYHEEV